MLPIKISSSWSNNVLNFLKGLVHVVVSGVLTCLGQIGHGWWGMNERCAHNFLGISRFLRLSHNWEISSVFIGLEAVDFKANPVSCILAVMISFRQELNKVIHLCRGGLLWYPLLPFSTVHWLSRTPKNIQIT